MNIYKSCASCGAILKLDSAANGIVTCPKCHNKAHTRDMKEVPSIVVTCPNCGTRIRSYVQRDDQRLKCGKCEFTAPIGQFKRDGEAVEESVAPKQDTVSPHSNIAPEPSILLHQNNTPNQESSRTVINTVHPPHQPNVAQDDGGGTRIGAINKLPIYGRPLQLQLYKERGEKVWYGEPLLPRFKEGRQVVGRAGKGADIECPTRDLYLSRSHFAIVVEYVARLGSYRHFITDNGHVNAVRVKLKGKDEWSTVAAGDMIIINAGDLIEAGHTTFEVVYKG